MAPEKRYWLDQPRNVMLLVRVLAGVCLALMLSHIPALYDLFNVQAAQTAPLWTLD